MYHKAVNSLTQSWIHEDGVIALLLRNKCTDIAHTNDEESNRLEKEEYVVVIIPKCEVVASTEEEVCCDTKLQKKQPDSTLMLSRENEKMNQKFRMDKVW